MPDTTKPTAQDAVEAYKTMQTWCKQTEICSSCPLNTHNDCFVYRFLEDNDAALPCQWPDLKEAPHA